MHSVTLFSHCRGLCAASAYPVQSLPRCSSHKERSFVNRIPQKPFAVIQTSSGKFRFKIGPGMEQAMFLFLWGSFFPRGNHTFFEEEERVRIPFFPRPRRSSTHLPSSLLSSDAHRFPLLDMPFRLAWKTPVRRPTVPLSVSPTVPPSWSLPLDAFWRVCDTAHF